MLARLITAPHVFAAYGPQDYECLLVSGGEQEADALLAELQRFFQHEGLSIRSATACYPRHGRSADALLAYANNTLRQTGSSVPGGGQETVECPVASLPSFNPAMMQANTMAEKAARSRINVLLLGETGVGKEVMARRIHRLSPRSAAPIVCLNCAGLQESLMESELFGHERGAFSGAVQTKQGLLEVADGGTVFLDEVGELSAALQAKLLRVLETREVMRLGSVKSRIVDVRFLAATNRDLEEEVRRGTFRKDLFFRLNGISILIPPLRQRVSEIGFLAKAFIVQAAERDGRDAPKMDPAVLDLLEGYGWPGNIRELRNIMERAVVLCEGRVINVDHLPMEKLRPKADLLHTGGDIPSINPWAGGSAGMSDEDRRRILAALEACAGNQTRAAKMLGIPRRTFVTRLDALNVPRPQKFKNK